MSAEGLPLRYDAAEAGQVTRQDDETDIVLQDPQGHMLTYPSSEAVAVLHKKWSALSAARRNEILSALPVHVMTNYGQAIEDLVVDKLKERRTMRIAERMRPFVEFVDILGSVASALDSTVPGASAIFRVVKSIFLASKALTEIQEFLVELIVDRVSGNLHLISEYRHLFPSSLELLSAALEIYSVVLDIGSRAAKFFYDDKGEKRNGFRLFAATSWSSCKGDLQALCRKFDVRIDNFGRAALLALSQATSSGLQTIAFGHSQQETHLRHIAAGLSENTRRLLEDKTQRSSELTAAQAKNRRELLQWIGKETAKLECAAIHDKLRRAAVEGTGQWLVNDITFELWLNQRGPRGLWISGKWGTGKSVLASSIVHMLLERCRVQDGAACAYIYCTSEYPFLSSGAATDVNSGKAISYKAVLGSILYQLYGALPQDQDVESLLHLWGQGTSILESHLEQAIRDILAMLKQAFLVIDGLDELQRMNDADFVALCKYIGSLNMATASSGPKILVLSRPDYPDISSAMQESAVIRIHGKANHDDIFAFVCEEVASLGRMGRHEQHLKSELVDRADGVFRWVSAVVSYVRHLKSPRARAEAVKNMPPSLKDVYAKILERILQQSDIDSNYAVVALLWVTHAFRPLSADEMTEALSIEPGMTQIDDDDRIDSRHIDDLCENCQGLLELSGGVYQLPHDSVRDFLLGAPDPNHLGLVKFWSMRDHVHERLAEACLNYLNLQVFDVDRTTFRREMNRLHKDYPLLRYAANHWGDHVRQAGDEYPASLDELVRGFLLSDNRREVTVQIVQDNEGPWRYQGSDTEDMLSPSNYTVPLHLVALFGLKHLLPTYGQDRTLFRHGDGFKFLPIDYAVLRNSKEAFDWILFHSLPGVEAGRMGEDSVYSLPFVAAIRDWADSLKMLLALGFDKDDSTQTPDGYRPLHAASMIGSLQVLRVLIDAGADINALNKSGETPLLLASRGRNSAVCKGLIDAGADINIKPENGVTVLHHLAAYDQELTTIMVERGAVFKATTEGYTPLHAAAVNGQVEIVRTLCHYLDKDSSRILGSELDRELELDDRLTVFMAAAVNGQVEVIKALVEEFGENPSQVTHTHKRTLLHLAAMSGEERFIPFIAGICGVDPNAQDVLGFTALHLAARKGHFGFMSCLSKTYQNLDYLIQDNRGQVPLHHAATHGMVKSVALLSHQGFDVSDHNGRLPFHLAVESGHLACVRLLLRQEIVDRPDAIGQTALHIAARARYHHIVRYLLDEGHAKELRDASGRTPLHIAAYFGLDDIVSSLVSAGFNVLCQDETGTTPLMYAMPFGLVRPSVVDQLLGPHREALELLNGEGMSCADLVASYGTPELWNRIWPDGYGNSSRLNLPGHRPMFSAAMNGNSHMLDFLARLGFGVDDSDDSGMTPLMYASLHGYGSVVKEILRLGANVDRRDQLGRTALHWAVFGNSPQLVRKLLEAGSTGILKDNLGLSAGDYAMTLPSLSRILGNNDQRKVGNNICGRVETLCAFIGATARNLSTAKDYGQKGPSPALQAWSLRHSLTLALRGLGRMNEALFIAQAEMVPPISWICDMCDTSIESSQTRRFQCLECADVDLCQYCYGKQPDGERPLEGSNCRKNLEILELQTRLVGQSLCPLTRFDAQSLGQILISDSMFRDWLALTGRQYQAVADAWPKPNTLDPVNFPGWQLITNMKKILEPSSREDGGFDDGMMALTHDLCEPRLMRGLQEEVKEFSCHGHRYLEVHPHMNCHHPENMVEDGESNFASDNKLNSSFYALLAQRYSPSGDIFQKLIAEQETKEATVTPDPGSGFEDNEKLPVKLPEGLESHDENPVNTLDNRAQHAERCLELLNTCTNPFPNPVKWQRPFCADKTLTLRDAMWQFSKAMIAGSADAELIVNPMLGTTSKLP